jgi:hypothetical protein
MRLNRIGLGHIHPLGIRCAVPVLGILQVRLLANLVARHLRLTRELQILRVTIARLSRRHPAVRRTVSAPVVPGTVPYTRLSAHGSGRGTRAGVEAVIARGHGHQSLFLLIEGKY